MHSLGFDVGMVGMLMEAGKASHATLSKHLNKQIDSGNKNQLILVALPVKVWTAYKNALL